ncbi:MAG: GAF domain-containing protein [Cytophagales bacterium]
MNTDWLKRNYIDISLATTLVLIILTGGLTILNRTYLEKNTAIRKQVEAAKSEFTYHVDQTMRHMDVGLRGYAIIHDRRYLYRSPEALRIDHTRNIARLDSILELQKYKDVGGKAALQELRKFMDDYLGYFTEMVSALDRGDTATFKKLFLLDKGASHGPVFSNAKGYLFQFEDALDNEALVNYKAALNRNLYLQIFLMIVGAPCIILVFYRIRNDRGNQLKLLAKLQATNRQYLFDSGEKTDVKDTELVVEETVSSLKYGAEFLTKISEGNYSLTWRGMSDKIKPLNTTNLAGTIIALHGKLHQFKEEEERRAWTNEGIALFAEVLRTKSTNITELGDSLLKQAITYLHANQGAFYVVNEDDDHRPFIEMISCYAYERKKFLTKQVQIGEGLVGQAVLEAETIVMKELPKGYLTITSGLGGAEPKFLIVVPIKAETKVYGILEIASFKVMKEYEIKFLERISQSIASAIASAKNNLKTQKLLEETQQQTEKLRAQEEEMRQNLEELTATQEEMARKEKEYLAKIEALEIQNRVGTA